MQHRSIVHMDLDSFFVSVERLQNSKLMGVPVIIGGSGGRGVVASCSYEARKFGVRSAMPGKMAKRLCPEAIFVRGDMERYSHFSKTVKEIIVEKAPLFEQASIDEFYLDISGMDKYFGCFKWTSELRETITRETGLPLSFGLSCNKTVSKIGTNEAKPNGKNYIMQGNEKNFLAPLDIMSIPMLGNKTGQMLKSMGVKKIKTLQEMPLELMRQVLGKNGKSIWEKANGICHAMVLPTHDRKSISTENTFQADTIDVKMLRAILTGMTEKIAFRLRKEQQLTSCVAVKIRYSNFDTYAKQMMIPYTANDKTLIGTALHLFDKLYEKRLLVRLVGVRFSHLVNGSYQINLFEDTSREVKLCEAMDNARKKFGAKVVSRASGFVKRKVGKG
ncbi:DNA polymerase IV [Flexithrix dorotheae]|uniref:DNA polymerase IV n=1 Tax=Flexithrix dorotheae TaxID=70993 RepID=UPI0005C75629|nr:DNA polymerase IV [Flexithrix dorotheae]